VQCCCGWIGLCVPLHRCLQHQKARHELTVRLCHATSALFCSAVQCLATMTPIAKMHVTATCPASAQLLGSSDLQYMRRSHLKRQLACAREGHICRTGHPHTWTTVLLLYSMSHAGSVNNVIACASACSVRSCCTKACHVQLATVPSPHLLAAC
jgi:hypothetical protein